MLQDPYREFALVYDDWQRLYPRPFSVAMGSRVRASVRTLRPPSCSLADLACGTGIFARWWKRTHPAWTVYGTDRSAAMIRVARRSPVDAPAVGATRGPARRPPRFLVQDLVDLALPEPVGVLTCLFDSLNHVTRAQDLRRILKRAARSLLPGGIFLFDLIDEVAFPEVFTGASIMDGRALFVGLETEYREERGRGMGLARFTLFRARGGRWRRIEFDIRERRWFRGEVRDLVGEAGLELVQLERIDPYSSKDFFVPRTFWVCRKR